MSTHRIAITGGIGSGKTYVCQILRRRGISVYDCDAAAKRLMRTSRSLQEALSRLVGKDVCRDGKLQKRILAEFLLKSEENKQAVNDIVHPAVAADYLQSGRQWLESAILFESGFHERIPFDWVICVTAPLSLRVSRIMQRDGISREKAFEWIERQMPQEEMASLSDLIIENDGVGDLERQVDEILKKIKHI